MDTVLALEIAVGEVALHVEGDSLDTRLVALLQVGDGHFVVVFLAVTLVHAHELFRPVLRLGASRARHNLEHGGHGVFLMGEHIAHLEILHGGKGVGVGIVHLLFGDNLVAEEVVTEREFVSCLAHFLIAFDPAFECLDLLHLRFRRLGIVPELGGLRVQFLLLELDAFLFNLKVLFEFVGALLDILKLFKGYHIGRV